VPNAAAAIGKTAMSENHRVKRARSLIGTGAEL
jgi:hypothetical protein